MLLCGEDYDFNNIDILSDIDLSTPELNLKHIRAGYREFFKAAKIERGFIRYEIEKIFKILLDYFSENESLIPRINIEEFLLSDELFSGLDIDDDIFIDIGSSGVIHGVFSLNLYFFMF